MLIEHESVGWKTYTLAQGRLVDDASSLGLWFVQQKVYRRISPRLQVGGGATLGEAKMNDGSWNTIVRLELEANPQWRLSERNTLAIRNRLELREWESRGYAPEFVSRHRVRFNRQARWFGGMRGVAVSNELFFDYAKGRISENRFRPIDLHYGLRGEATANTYLLVRSRRLVNDRRWVHAFVVGFGIRLGR